MEPSSPLASLIVQRALGDLSTLEKITPAIRAHREWCRQSVLLPLLQRITAADLQQASDMRSAAVRYMPEFLADPEVRRAATMGPLQTEAEIANMERLAHEMKSYPAGGVVAGAPITDEDPALVRGYPLMNGSVRSGTCDVCGTDALLTYEANLMIHDRIASLQLRACADCEELLAGDEQQLVRHLYTEGRFL